MLITFDSLNCYFHLLWPLISTFKLWTHLLIYNPTFSFTSYLPSLGVLMIQVYSFPPMPEGSQIPTTKFTLPLSCTFSITFSSYGGRVHSSFSRFQGHLLTLANIFTAELYLIFAADICITTMSASLSAVVSDSERVLCTSCLKIRLPTSHRSVYTEVLYHISSKNKVGYY